jgi:hypothetical protein
VQLVLASLKEGGQALEGGVHFVWQAMLTKDDVHLGDNLANLNPSVVWFAKC